MVACSVTPLEQAAIAVFGAHVLLDQLYTTVRFRLDHL